MNRTEAAGSGGKSAAAAVATVHIWLTTDEAAAYCRMSRRWLLQLARTGRVQGEQVGGKGGHWRFHRDWLDALLTGAHPARRSA